LLKDYYEIYVRVKNNNNNHDEIIIEATFEDKLDLLDDMINAPDLDPELIALWKKLIK
jgi:hypothetical protein